MNFKICDKCPYKNQEYFNSSLIYLHSENDIFIGIYDALVKHQEFYCMLHLKNKKIKKKTMLFDELKKTPGIEPDKSCPFYVEHTINDWNDKNES